MKGQFKFEGDGKEMFSLFFIQGIITAVTFGLYAPWAMVKICQYLCSKTTLGGKQFEFKGEGGELFSIYIIHLIILTGITAGLYAPWAIVKLLKYIAQNLELDGKTFDFKGEGGELFSIYIIHLVILTGITAGLYVPWAITKVLKYVTENLSYDGKNFGYTGEGGELFSTYLIHVYILTAITLGIYGAWAIAKLKNYIVSNITYGDTEKFKLELDGAELFSIYIIHFGILTTITCGLYFPWALCKYITYAAEKCRVD